jgi:serine/threonine-protein kinase
MGTLDYMAPELLSGAEATIASDVYSLGTVAYRMITGQMPFASTIQPAINASLMAAPPPRCDSANQMRLH